MERQALSPLTNSTNVGKQATWQKDKRTSLETFHISSAFAVAGNVSESESGVAASKTIPSVHISSKSAEFNTGCEGLEGDAISITIGQFRAVPTIDFGRVERGQVKEVYLAVKNPGFLAARISVLKFPTEKGFSISWDEEDNDSNSNDEDDSVVRNYVWSECLWQIRYYLVHRTATMSTFSFQV